MFLLDYRDPRFYLYKFASFCDIFDTILVSLLSYYLEKLEFRAFIQILIFPPPRLVSLFALTTFVASLLT